MDFLKKKRFKVLLAVLALLFGMMIYSASTYGFASVPEKMLSYVTIPVQRFTASVSDAAGGFFGRFSKYDDVVAENEALQREIDELREKVVDYDSLKEENEHLKSITGIKEEHPDYEFVSAAVVGRDPDNLSETFTIDKGTLHGVSLQDPVLTASGLVGIVEEVGPNYAVVTTLLSPQLKVGAAASSSDQLGVVTGDLELASEGNTMLMYLDRPASAGDIVSTSGSSGLYPKGLVIGTVRSSRMQDSGTSYYAVVEPANDIAEVRDVFILVDFLGKGEVE